MGKLSSIFELISQRGRTGFFPGSWSWKTLRWIEFRQKKWHFFVTGPGPCQIKMTSVDFILSREEQWLCILRDLGAVSQLKNFHSAFSPDPTDCPWVSEDIDGGYAIKAKKTKTKKNGSSWADTKHRGIHHRQVFFIHFNSFLAFVDLSILFLIQSLLFSTRQAQRSLVNFGM